MFGSISFTELSSRKGRSFPT